MIDLPEGFADTNQLSIEILIFITKAAHGVAEFTFTMHIVHTSSEWWFDLLYVNKIIL